MGFPLPSGAVVAAESPPHEIPLKVTQPRSNQIEMKELGQGEWQLHTTGHDPYFFIESGGVPINLQAQPIFSFEYFSPGGIGSSLLFVGQVLDETHLITVEDLTRREGWATASIDLTTTLSPPAGPVTSLRLRVGNHPGVEARIRNLVARPQTVPERQITEMRARRRADDKLRSERLKAYFSKVFHAEITAVLATETQLSLHGHTADPENLQLAEVPMWEDTTQLKDPLTLLPITFAPDGKFDLQLPRITPDMGSCLQGRVRFRTMFRTALS
jgi:hypothetical protein